MLELGIAIGWITGCIFTYWWFRHEIATYWYRDRQFRSRTDD
jgi:hypothetical protein